MRGEHLPGGNWFAKSFIQQESTFWRRSLWERAGGYIDTSFELAGDFELWARFYQKTDLFAIQTPLGGFRLHADQKTGQHMERYLLEAQQVLLRYGGRPYGRLESFVRSRWSQYFPGRFQRFAQKLRLLHPRNICVYDNLRREWQVATI